VSVSARQLQTETGGIICSALPGAMDMKPGSAALPFFGIDIAIIDPLTGERLDHDQQDGDVEGVVAVRSTWPGMARTVYGDHSVGFVVVVVCVCVYVSVWASE
jgi:acetyl-CoA synthetase